MIIYSDNIYTFEGLRSGYLEIVGDKIIGIYPKRSPLKAQHDFGNLRVIPGIIDTHNHGACGYRFDEVDEDELCALLKGEAAYGVTSVFATTIILQQWPLIAKFTKEYNEGAQVIGINSEGPWGSRVGEKGINLGYPEVDLEYAKNMLECANGALKVVDIAPEVPKALEAVDLFVDNKVVVSAYHTNANYREAKKGFESGISVATHLANVMTGLHHRDVGTMGAAILNDNVWCELICDGLHVSLEMVELIMKMKRHDRIMMVSDNGMYLGAPVGHYKGQKKNANNDRAVIEVTEDGFVISKTGRLSGSSKPVLYGIKNLVEKLKMPMEEVLRFSSFNPARKYGLTEKGEININKDADFVVIDDDYNVVATFNRGRIVFDREKEELPFNEKFLKENKLD